MTDSLSQADRYLLTACTVLDTMPAEVRVEANTIVQAALTAMRTELADALPDPQDIEGAMMLASATAMVMGLADVPATLLATLQAYAKADGPPAMATGWA